MKDKYILQIGDLARYPRTPRAGRFGYGQWSGIGVVTKVIRHGSPYYQNEDATVTLYSFSLNKEIREYNTHLECVSRRKCTETPNN